MRLLILVILGFGCRSIDKGMECGEGTHAEAGTCVPDVVESDDVDARLHERSLARHCGRGLGGVS